MADNHIVERFDTQRDLAAEIPHILGEIERETGFIAQHEIQRRTIYDADKVWRVRIVGTFEGRPAVLRVENIKLETDEEEIRRAFRAQAADSCVRPPETYAYQVFDEAKGYGYSLDEEVRGAPLFVAKAALPHEAASAFAVFYRLLRETVKDPFWENQTGDIRAFSEKQCDKWHDLAKQKTPEHTERVERETMKIREAYLSSLSDAPLRFQHAHLSGEDVRVNEQGEYIVFANHFWSWRQPGYDVAFPLWHQWMSLPIERRSAEGVAHVTDAWLEMIGRDLGDLVSIKEMRPMLLNRLYGALLLDIPAKIGQRGETEESVGRLEEACLKEAERWIVAV